MDNPISIDSDFIQDKNYYQQPLFFENKLSLGIDKLEYSNDLINGYFVASKDSKMYLYLLDTLTSISGDYPIYVNSEVIQDFVLDNGTCVYTYFKGSSLFLNFLTIDDVFSISNNQSSQQIIVNEDIVSLHVLRRETTLFVYIVSETKIRIYTINESISYVATIPITSTEPIVSSQLFGSKIVLRFANMDNSFQIVQFTEYITPAFEDVTLTQDIVSLFSREGGVGFGVCLADKRPYVFLNSVDYDTQELLINGKLLNMDVDALRFSEDEKYILISRLNSVSIKELILYSCNTQSTTHYFNNLTNVFDSFKCDPSVSVVSFFNGTEVDIVKLQISTFFRKANKKVMDQAVNSNYGSVNLPVGTLIQGKTSTLGGVQAFSNNMITDLAPTAKGQIQEKFFTSGGVIASADYDSQSFKCAYNNGCMVNTGVVPPMATNWSEDRLSTEIPADETLTYIYDKLDSSVDLKKDIFCRDKTDSLITYAATGNKYYSDITDVVNPTYGPELWPPVNLRHDIRITPDGNNYTYESMPTPGQYLPKTMGIWAENFIEEKKLYHITFSLTMRYLSTLGKLYLTLNGYDILMLEYTATTCSFYYFSYTPGELSFLSTYKAFPHITDLSVKEITAYDSITGTVVEEIRFTQCQHDTDGKIGYAISDVAFTFGGVTGFHYLEDMLSSGHADLVNLNIATNEEYYRPETNPYAVFETFYGSTYKQLYNFKYDLKGKGLYGGEEVSFDWSTVDPDHEAFTGDNATTWRYGKPTTTSVVYYHCLVSTSPGQSPATHPLNWVQICVDKRPRTIRAWDSELSYSSKIGQGSPDGTLGYPIKGSTELLYDGEGSPVLDYKTGNHLTKGDWKYNEKVLDPEWGDVPLLREYAKDEDGNISVEYVLKDGKNQYMPLDFEGVPYVMTGADGDEYFYFNLFRNTTPQYSYNQHDNFRSEDIAENYIGELEISAYYKYQKDNPDFEDNIVKNNISRKTHYSHGSLDRGMNATRYGDYFDSDFPPSWYWPWKEQKYLTENELFTYLSPFYPVGVKSPNYFALPYVHLTSNDLTCGLSSLTEEDITIYFAYTCTTGRYFSFHSYFCKTDKLCIVQFLNTEKQPGSSIGSNGEGRSFYIVYRYTDISDVSTYSVTDVFVNSYSGAGAYRLMDFNDFLISVQTTGTLSQVAEIVDDKITYVSNSISNAGYLPTIATQVTNRSKYGCTASMVDGNIKKIFDFNDPAYTYFIMGWKGAIEGTTLYKINVLQSSKDELVYLKRILCTSQTTCNYLIKSLCLNYLLLGPIYDSDVGYIYYVLDDATLTIQDSFSLPNQVIPYFFSDLGTYFLGMDYSDHLNYMVTSDYKIKVISQTIDEKKEFWKFQDANTLKTVAVGKPYAFGEDEAIDTYVNGSTDLLYIEAEKAIPLVPPEVTVDTEITVTADIGAIKYLNVALGDTVNYDTSTWATYVVPLTRHTGGGKLYCFAEQEYYADSEMVITEY